MVAFINMTDISKSPEWNPDVSTLPLSVNEAIQAVKAYINNSQHPMHIKEIEIRPVPKHENIGTI